MNKYTEINEYNFQSYYAIVDYNDGRIEGFTDTEPNFSTQRQYLDSNFAFVPVTKEEKENLENNFSFWSKYN